MGFNFRDVDREQQFLMPPSVLEWLPEDHLAWFVIDAVEAFDLGGFVACYREDGRGGAAYEPATMVAVLVYAYCVGDCSSRLIERRLAEDVAYRVVAANQRPDHATIARFRAEHEDALAGLFGQVLALCAEAGMVRVGVVAVDGTKIRADASGTQNMTADAPDRALDAEARRIIEEAKAIDRVEDEQFGNARGDELPPELADRSRRLARLREAEARLEAEAGRSKDAARVNVTDPDSRIMKTPSGFVQGFNAQAAVTADQILVAAELTASPVDVHELEPVVTATRANLDEVGVGEAIGTIVADAGYYSTKNALLETGAELLIAPTKGASLPTKAPAEPEDRRGEAAQLERERAARMAEVFDRSLTNEITLTAAASELGLSLSRACVLRQDYQRHGLDALVRRKRANGEGRGPRPVERSRRVRHAMLRRFASARARFLYAQRSIAIEPVFGQIKAARGVRRFQRRGLAACASEWKLLAATHNLLKLWRHQLAIT